MKLASQFIKELQELINVKEVKLTTKDKALCLCYKLFYNEYPDFSSKDINIKMQTMLSLLDEFGICTLENYSFKLNSKKMPVSITLSQDIYKLTPLGKIEEVDKSLRIDYEIEREIKIVSREIKKHIPEDTNELEFLKKINTIFYCSRNCLPTHAAIESIAEVCEYPIEEIDSTIKLIRKIERKKYN